MQLEPSKQLSPEQGTHVPKVATRKRVEVGVEHSLEVVSKHLEEPQGRQVPVVETRKRVEVGVEQE
jgi:hypothetical protein